MQINSKHLLSYRIKNYQAAIREAKKKEFILDGDQAINEVRQ